MLINAKSSRKNKKSSLLKVANFIFWIICFIAVLTLLAGLIAPIITFLNTVGISC